ncbi:MAG TPA: hypothetical protein VGR37_10190 [Longimicrobiaceae bacterium]|nr:hypothetical protein [Longimicrobiaceae bacterium]
MPGDRERAGSPARTPAVVSRRRAEAFRRGVALRAAYMLEYRDLGDPEAEDGGVCFAFLRSEADVDAAVEELGEDNPYERLLGVFDLRRPLAEQGAGLTGDEWLERQRQGPASR